MPRRSSPMFYAVSIFNGMKAGDTVIHSGQRMRLVKLEAIPGGTSAELAPIEGETYPHPTRIR